MTSFIYLFLNIISSNGEILTMAFIYLFIYLITIYP